MVPSGHRWFQIDRRKRHDVQPRCNMDSCIAFEARSRFAATDAHLRKLIHSPLGRCDERTRYRGPPRDCAVAMILDKEPLRRKLAKLGDLQSSV